MLNLTYPVDIGTWCSYGLCSPEDQKKLQLDSLQHVSMALRTTEGELNLIYTKHIAELLEYLDQVSKEELTTDKDKVLIDEVYFSSKIEGARLSQRRAAELFAGSPVKESNAKSEHMVVGGFKTAKNLSVLGGDMFKQVLCTLWDVLVANCCENESIRGSYGEYRCGDVQVGSHVCLD